MQITYFNKLKKTFMKKIFLIICLISNIVLFAQSDSYGFISKDLHPIDKNTQYLVQINKKPLKLDSIEFYSSEGKKLDKMSAVTLLQDSSYKAEMFIDKALEVKAMVLKPKTEQEKEQEKMTMSTSNTAPATTATVPAPAFNTMLLNGKKAVFEPGKSQTLYVLNFWFTSCVPCKVEIPELNRLVEKYKEKNVTFVAITFENKDQVTKFLKKKAFNYSVAPSEKKLINLFKISAYPTNIIINQKGDIIFREEGLSSNIFDRLDKVIAENVK